MWMLTFNVILGHQGVLFRDFCDFFFYQVFFSIPATDSISGNAFDAKRKENRGWPKLNMYLGKLCHIFILNLHLTFSGFELGFSMTNPFALVCWEAQFGDFNNTAQV